MRKVGGALAWGDTVGGETWGANSGRNGRRPRGSWTWTLLSIGQSFEDTAGRAVDGREMGHDEALVYPRARSPGVQAQPSESRMRDRVRGVLDEKESIFA